MKIDLSVIKWNKAETKKNGKLQLNDELKELLTVLVYLKKIKTFVGVNSKVKKLLFLENAASKTKYLN